MKREGKWVFRGKGKLTNMAMYEPYAWVIGPKCNSQIAFSGQKCYISPRRVVEVEGADAGIDVIGIGALSEDNKVMAVEMDRVSSGSVNFDWEVCKFLTSNDKVDKALVKVLRYNGIFWIESSVFEIENRRVREIEPGNR